MLIARDQQIAGLPAVSARELMRAIRDHAVCVGVIGELVGVSDEDAGTILQRLVSEGFVCRTDPTLRLRGAWLRSDEARTGPEKVSLMLWGTTIAGNALSKARIGKPMRRRRAQELLDGLIARSVAINEDPRSAFTIERIEIFGSFADPSRSEVGDVDVHLLFDRRVDGHRFVAMAMAAANAAEESGRRFGSHIQRLTYLEKEFRRQVQGGSPRLDIQFDAVGHDGNRLPEGVITRLVYSRSPS